VLIYYSDFASVEIVIKNYLLTYLRIALRPVSANAQRKIRNANIITWFEVPTLALRCVGYVEFRGLRCVFVENAPYN